MTTLTRWDPFREMAMLRDRMDRLWDDRLEAPRIWTRPFEGFGLSLDIAEEEDAFIVKASVPGVDPEDVEVTLTDNVLTIKGEAREDTEIEEENYHLRERRYGSFMRSVSLPMAVLAENVEATTENGVMTLRLPKAADVKPRRIPVRTSVNGNTK